MKIFPNKDCDKECGHKGPHSDNEGGCDLGCTFYNTRVPQAPGNLYPKLRKTERQSFLNWLAVGVM
jgi:hypothetical protein